MPKWPSVHNSAYPDHPYENRVGAERSRRAAFKVILNTFSGFKLERAPGEHVALVWSVSLTRIGSSWVPWVDAPSWRHRVDDWI